MPGMVQGVDLDQLKAKVDASVPKALRSGYNKTMAAGMKLMFSDETFPEMQKYVEGIQSPEQIPDMVAHGIAKGMSILMNESKGHLPVESAGAAAHGLMTQALSYLQHKGMTIDNNTVAATTKAVNQAMVHIIQQYSGLDDQQMQQVLQGKGKSLIQQDMPQQNAAQQGAAEQSEADQQNAEM